MDYIVQRSQHVNYRTSDHLAKGCNFLPVTEYEQIIKFSDVPQEVGFGKVLPEQVFDKPLGELSEIVEETLMLSIQVLFYHLGIWGENSG